METLCKFKCVSVLFNEQTATVSLEAVTKDDPINANFFKYTPSGTIVLQIVKPEVAAQFKPGKTNYINLYDLEGPE